MAKNKSNPTYTKLVNHYESLWFKIYIRFDMPETILHITENNAHNIWDRIFEK